MKIVRFVKRVIQAILGQDEIIARLSETVQGLDNQSKLLANRLDQLVIGLDNQSKILNIKLERLIDGVKSHSQLVNRRATEVVKALEYRSYLGSSTSGGRKSCANGDQW